MFRKSRGFQRINYGYCLVGFFLFGSLEHYVQKHYGILYESSGGEINHKQAFKAARLDVFGWYLQIKAVAEKGVFTFGNNSPIKSVEKTNLFDFLLYLTAEKAEGVYQKKLREYESRGTGR